MPITLEICVTSVDEVRAALAMPGVSRVEFCAALDEGGLTPRIEDLHQLTASELQHTAVMLRTRGGDFHYDPVEIARMCSEAAALRSSGANALVFGALLPDRTIDVAAIQALQRAAPGELVFHRAFDQVTDQAAALEALCELGVRRILTSGGAADAASGAANLARLSALARGRIEIMAGGGIRAENVRDLIRASGVQQVHSAARDRHSGRYGPLMLVEGLAAALRSLGCE